MTDLGLLGQQRAPRPRVLSSAALRLVPGPNVLRGRKGDAGRQQDIHSLAVDVVAPASGTGQGA